MAKQEKYERKVTPNKTDEREARTGMRQSTGAMIAKIAIGAMFIFIGFEPPDSGWSIGYFAVALCTGGALIAWGLVPYLSARSKRKAAEEAKKEERAAKILSVPLEKFSDGEAKKAESLAKQYEAKASEPAVTRATARIAKLTEDGPAESVLGIDWNKDGKLDWKDAVVDQAVIREGKASLFGEEDGPKDA